MAILFDLVNCNHFEDCGILARCFFQESSRMRFANTMRRASPAYMKATTCVTSYRRRRALLIPNLLANHKLNHKQK